ncbi:MAG: HNH endonuclease signature motif containing protein [Patescibacteria group bacterium]
MRSNRWTDSELIESALKSTSIRQVLIKLKLRETGGNYIHIKRKIESLNLSTAHFTGKAWNRGKRFGIMPRYSLEDILVENSTFQTYKLRNRLFFEQIKEKKCEICGWAKQSVDGRIPLELDHINGNRNDNRIENLRILCPNCHSLQPTHRGRNKIKKLAGW